jgi:hypothetical protein
MSNVKIKANASGSADFTIEAPATDSALTLTLPAETGSLLTNASDLPAANLTGTLPAIDGSNLTNLSGGGKLLQVIWAKPSFGETSITSGSYVEVSSAMRTSITPVSATSKLYIFLNAWFMTNGEGGPDASGSFRLTKYDGTHTDLGVAAARRNYDRGGSGIQLEQLTPLSVEYDHNTTSQLTFSVQAYKSAGESVRFLGNGYTQITIMEVEQ